MNGKADVHAELGSVSGNAARTRATAIAGLTLLVLAGCSGDAGSGESGVIVDTLSSGAVAVRSPALGLWAEGEGWRLTEELRIGTATEGGPEAFADVRGLAVDEAGRIWVLDVQDAEIRVFDRSGNFVRTVGGQGEGPGEFTYPNGLVRGPDGNMYVFDPRVGRISVFDTAGRYLEGQRRVSGGWGFLWRGGFADDGTLFDYRVQVGVVELGPDMSVRDTIDPPASTQGTDLYFSGPTPQGGRRVMSVPYLGQPTWEVGPDGDIWTTPTRPYRFDVVSPQEGDTVRIVERVYTPVPVSSSERDRAEARLDSLFAPDADLDLSRIPETKPALEEFFFDPDGNLWARPYMPGDSTGRALDVFDSEGRFLGRVELPVKLRRWPEPVVRDGWLWGVTLDELEVPYVVGMRIER
jgi:hypothetical protein